MSWFIVNFTNLTLWCKIIQRLYEGMKYREIFNIVNIILNTDCVTYLKCNIAQFQFKVNHKLPMILRSLGSYVHYGVSHL